MPNQVISLPSKEDVYVVDVRSDTITKPTSAMRKLMAVTEVGDSSIDEDPSVNELERRCAALLGKEDAVYCTSGTLCNLISIMIYCDKRGDEYITGDKSHSFLYEQAGAAVFAGAQCSLVNNLPDGTFCLEEVENKIKIDSTALIMVENTHSVCGGKVLPLEWLDSLSELARKYNIPVYMDGARIMNAVVQSGIPAKRYARDMDSVFFCLSKGLACPMGSVLCGRKTFIEEAKRVRKLLGGSVRQIGIVAATGLIALDEMIDRLQIDHDHAYQIGKAIDDMDSDVFQVDLKGIHTNILPIHLNRKVITANKFLERLSNVKETDDIKVCVRGGVVNSGLVHLVLHWEITDEDVRQAIDKIRMVIRQVHQEF